MAGLFFMLICSSFGWTCTTFLSWFSPCWLRPCLPSTTPIQHPGKTNDCKCAQKFFSFFFEGKETIMQRKQVTKGSVLVLLRKFGSCHSCTADITDLTHSFMEMVFSAGCGIFLQGNAPYIRANMIQEWFEDRRRGQKTKSSSWTSIWQEVIITLCLVDLYQDTRLIMILLFKIYCQIIGPP